MQHRRTLTEGLMAGEQPGANFAPDLHDARHLWLKAVLLLLWALVSFGVSYFARDLQIMVGGWQLGYWLASQGTVLMFIVIVGVYCVAMDYFERQDLAAQGKDGAAQPHD
ncbi:MAG: DUF4212 domain-containing protein [Proteobacteria bacterium]|nr:DUF4212 domain-containing protein [Pseudomonadota bacterium]MBS0492926.1 DUF4212 domain-containing protein [Pseudomonadota bacterium]